MAMKTSSIEKRNEFAELLEACSTQCGRFEVIDGLAADRSGPIIRLAGPHLDVMMVFGSDRCNIYQIVAQETVFWGALNYDRRHFFVDLVVNVCLLGVSVSADLIEEARLKDKKCFATKTPKLRPIRRSKRTSKPKGRE